MDQRRPQDGTEVYTARLSCGILGGMIRCAITSGRGSQSPEELIADARRWAAAGVDVVQLREKHLEAGDLLRLAKAIVDVFREHGGAIRLLVNGRADVAAAAGADGVHLSAQPGELTPAQVRRVFAGAGARKPVVSVSCHTLVEVRRAAEAGVEMILFGPVFEKRLGNEVVVEGVGLEALREACTAAEATPVLALGGVTRLNARLSVGAGAAGIAGIRLFRERQQL